MDMEGALRARLLGAAPVTALLPNYTPQGGTPTKTVFWEERPQNSPLPAIVLHVIVDDRDQHLGGFQTVKDALVQIDVWATSFASKKAIKEAVIAALAPPQSANGIRFQGATQVSARPQNERIETLYIFRDVIEMRLHYSNT